MTGVLNNIFICIVFEMILFFVPNTVLANVIPELQASRVSGVAPLAIFFDATATTCDTCGHPYHDLNYAWDFKDGISQTWTYSGKPKNIAYGPVSAHVFETPGTYTVDLVVSGEGTLVSKSITITVTDPDLLWSGTNTHCFSTSGIFAECPAGAVKTTTPNFNSAMATCHGTGRRCLFRRGETFTGTQITLTANGPSMIGAFGPGSSLPRLNFTNTGGISFKFFNANDWRIVELELDGPGLGPFVQAFRAESRLENLLIFKTKTVPNSFKNTFFFSGNVLDALGASPHNGIFVVDNNWEDTGTFMFLTARRLSIMGNRFYDSTHSEHVIRVQHAEGLVLAHNSLGVSSASKQTLTIRSRPMNKPCSAGCGTPTHNLVISDNRFQVNTALPIGMVQRNAVDDLPKGEDILFERNFIEKAQAAPDFDVTIGVLFERADRVTVRNNIVFMKDWKFFTGLVAVSGTEIKMSHNSCYTPNNSASTVRCVRFRFATPPTSSAYNNLFYAPGATNTKVVDTESILMAEQGNFLAGVNPYASSALTQPLNYQLQPGSLAIDAGSLGDGILLDFNLVSRPQGAAPDAGAFEFQSGAPPQLSAPGVPKIIAGGPVE